MEIKVKAKASSNVLLVVVTFKVDDAIRFVSQKSKEKTRSLDDSNEDEKESRRCVDFHVSMEPSI